MYNYILNSTSFRTSSQADKELSKIEGLDFIAVKNSPLRNREDLIRLIQTVYAWMPTMITPFYLVNDISEIDFKRLFNLSKKARSGKLVDGEEKELFKNLALITNNHMVGASKVLMILNPEKYPIFDSRVISAWNEIFTPDLRDISIKTNPDLAIGYYDFYRENLLEWAKKENKRIRQYEFLLYVKGKSIQLAENEAKKERKKNRK
jgi:hypothetical protein